MKPPLPVMTPSAGFEAAFVDGPAGPIFTLRFPALGPEAGAGLLLVPPFGEDMNRARRFMAAAGRTLAALGWHVWLPDLHGTGDSAGSFAEARWSTWQTELDVLTDRLTAGTGGPVQLVGVRTGALLVASLAHLGPERVAGLTLIQPVSDGGRYLDQLLRVRVAAAMTHGRRETRAELRAAWSAGAGVEIGGYHIAAELAHELDACRLADRPPPEGLPVAWLDIAAPGSPPPAPPLPASWACESVTRHAVAAPPVWQLAEPEPAEALVSALCQVLPTPTATGTPTAALPATAPSGASEVALTFDCVGTPAVAVLHRPPAPRPVGVAIVVGGPQYRVGGHRQFVDLARDLAAAGVAVFRFDYRGIGDSPAEHPGFPNIAPDIDAALARFRAEVPELQGVALWALCDGVPAAAQLAAQTHGVAGLAAVNPWVREPATHDRTLLRHYYLKRPFQRDFWVNLLRGRAHTGDFVRLATRALRRATGPRAESGPGTHGAPGGHAGLAERLVANLAVAPASVLVLLSGQDLTAREFEDTVRPMPAWQRLSRSPRVEIARLPAADHTCAGVEAQTASTRATLAWLERLPQPSDAPVRNASPAQPARLSPTRALSQ